MTMGQYIRKRRTQLDLSLREFARKVGKSAGFISDVELGRRHPSGSVLDEIASVLGTTRSDIETYDCRPPIDELREKAATNPAYGVAFRKVLESDVTPEQIEKWLADLTKKENKRQ